MNMKEQLRKGEINWGIYTKFRNQAKIKWVKIKAKNEVKTEVAKQN